MTEIKEVSRQEIRTFIDKWCECKKETPCICLLAKVRKKCFVAVDNTTGDCWTESFKSKKKAIKWLERA